MSAKDPSMTKLVANMTLVEEKHRAVLAKHEFEHLQKSLLITNVF